MTAREWEREEVQARKDLDRVRREIEATRVGVPGTRRPGGRTARKDPPRGRG